LIRSALVVLSEAQSREMERSCGRAQKKNPVAATESALAAGQKIYSENLRYVSRENRRRDGQPSSSSYSPGETLDQS